MPPSLELNVSSFVHVIFLQLSERTSGSQSVFPWGERGHVLHPSEIVKHLLSSSFLESP